MCPRHPGLPEHRASTALLPRVPPGVGSPSTRPVGQLQRSLVLNPDSLGCWRSAIIPKLLPLAGHSSGHSSGDPVGCQCPREDALHQGRWRMSQNVVLGARSDPIASPEQGRGIAQRVRTSPVYSGLGGSPEPPAHPAARSLGSPPAPAGCPCLSPHRLQGEPRHRARRDARQALHEGRRGRW